jgi:hypothetical protein
MLLRRITEHVKSQNWTAIVIDFAIVVVGVFIGIQVSNWNEERQDASRTQSYYKRLLGDLESERRALLARLDYLAVTGEYGQSALAAFSVPANMHSSRFLIDAYQASQIWTYAVQRATYDEILASGIAEAIPDPVLRIQLANLFLNAELVRQVVVATTPYRQQIRFYMPYEMQAAVRETCSDRFILTDNNLLILELPDTCSLEFSEDQIDTAIDALGEYEQFERELVQRLASIDVTRAAIEPQLLLIDSLAGELRSRLQ